MSKKKLFSKPAKPKRKPRNKRQTKVDKLPLRVREKIEMLMLDEAYTYEQITEWCKERGHDVSRTGIANFGRRFFNVYQNVRRFEAQAKLFSSNSDKDMQMEAAVAKMIMEKVTDALINDDLDIVEHGALITAFAALQNSNATRERLLAQLAESTAKVAADVSVTVRQRGLSEDEAEEIRVKILGASL